MNFQLATPIPALLAMFSFVATGAATQTDSGTGPDMVSLKAAFDGALHEAIPTASGFRFNNRQGQLSVDLDGRGLEMVASGSRWGLELASYGYQGAAKVHVDQAKVNAQGNRVTYSWGAGLDEWFVNDAGGLEHGYTLQDRPEGAAAGTALIFDLEVRGDLLPSTYGRGLNVRFLDDVGNVVVTYSGLKVFDATGRALASHFEPRKSELRLSIDDIGASYPLTIDPVIQLGYLKALDPDSGDWFGDAVAISGNTAVIGVPRDDSSSTGAYGDEFDNGSNRSGAAYVFGLNGSTWTQQAFLKASNNSPSDTFGSSVDIDGDTIVVGAPFEGSSATGVNGDQAAPYVIDAGAVYVFSRFGLTWGQQAYIKATNTEASDRFGSSVGVSGDLIVVGAPGEDSNATGINGNQSDNSLWGSGAAYVYLRNGFTWSAQLYLKASNPDISDEFGVAVAIEGTRIAVAALGEDSAATGINGDQQNENAIGSGAVYIFKQKGELWVQDAYIKASNTNLTDRFGTAVALSNDTLAVGAPREQSSATGINGNQVDNSTDDSGAAYIFVDNGTSWSQQAYIKASNTALGALFAGSLDLSGDRLIVGSRLEDGAARGANGDEQDQSAQDSGAAYSYTRSAGVWSQDAYLKASNPDNSDHFGTAVGISGNTAIIGAPFEDSSGGGINGAQTDNNAILSGAAYAFELSSPWGVAKYGPKTGANIADLNSYTAPLINQFMTLELSEWNTSGLAFLMVSTAPANLPFVGGTLLVDPNLTFFGPNTVLFVPITNKAGSYTTFVPPLLAGQTVYAQAAMFDTNLPGGIALTNGISISVP